ncbi:Methyltransferase domain-containing protein [Micromonospora haikouensis]|uniref:Methyltransferase domain-containing protein n=1 Tax=Micromonospora haikouensis TaxID=686309 RepID=A0A1C4YNP9_9ACTN|nr:class I SAM-dependent methyltransferase [Micromonospora haikouensis]SCF22314.1 Methyltransferase domain-containing protein [Micromonospora haikouensis]
MIDQTIAQASFAELLRRWDVQQDIYIEQRERVFTVMFDVLEQFCRQPGLTVLDLACGPGAISERFLRRFPEGRAVALDTDPVLLAIGEGGLGDQGGRLRWVRADLRDPSWSERLGPESGEGSFDAVLSSTALHWLTPPALTAVYRTAAGLLRPGGVLVNADYLPLSAGSRLRAACEAIDRGRQQHAIEAGAEPWEDWWAAVEAHPALADAVAERQTLWPEGARDWTGATLDYHQAALVEAGLTEVGVIWQDLEERVLVAIR